VIAAAFTMAHAYQWTAACIVAAITFGIIASTMVNRSDHPGRWAAAEDWSIVVAVGFAAITVLLAVVS
jgi:hypothetical protein